MNILRFHLRANPASPPTESQLRLGLTVTMLAGMVFALTALASPATGAPKAVKPGGTCLKTQAGKRSGTLTCTKVGKVFRWKSASDAPAVATPDAASATIASSSSSPRFDLLQAVNAAVKPAGFTFTSTLCESSTGDCFGNLLFGSDRAELSIAGMSQAQWDLNQTLGLTKSTKPGPVLYGNMNNGQLFLPMSNPNAVYPVYTLTITGFGLTVPEGVAQMADIIRPIAPVLELISKR